MDKKKLRDKEEDRELRAADKYRMARVQRTAEEEEREVDDG